MTRSRSILIGDVHGCLMELQALICRLAPLPDEIPWCFSGTLVDKGSDSPGVVCWVRAFSTVASVVFIEGNHEEKHRRWRQHMRRGSPVAHTMTGTPQIAALTQALSAADIAFWRPASSIVERLQCAQGQVKKVARGMENTFGALRTG